MNPTVSVKNLTRTFQVQVKNPGLKASIGSLFFRRYRQLKAVNDVSFDLQQGELVGFIGPNGAGKTTTLKCLSGLLYPSSGEIRVLGYEPTRRQPEFLRQISFVMGQKNQLWWDIPPQETFLLNRAIYNISDTDYTKRLKFLMAELKLDKEISIPTRKLSLGQRMKCEFVAALLHQPKVVFLDEPTIGLDVVVQKRIRNFIREYNRNSKSTIILTSHYMRDVAELCKRVIIIDDGRIYFDGNLDDLIAQYASNKVLKFTFKNHVPQRELKVYGDLVDYHPYKATLSVEKGKALEIAGKIIRHYPVTDLNIEDLPVEEIIANIFTSKFV